MTEHLPGTSRSPVVQVIVGVIAAVAFMAAAFEAWYRFVLIPASIRGHRVGFAIQALKNELRIMIQDEGLPVPQSFGDILDHARARGSDRVNGMDGIDPWGSPYFFEVVPSQSYGETGRDIVVRSFGPNRRDDSGMGDDSQEIEQVILVPEVR
jgi:hypothetical protein